MFRNVPRCSMFLVLSDGHAIQIINAIQIVKSRQVNFYLNSHRNYKLVQIRALKYKKSRDWEGKKVSIVGSFAEFGTPKYFVELTE